MAFADNLKALPSVAHLAALDEVDERRGTPGPPERPQGEGYAEMLGGFYEMTMEPMLARLGSRLDADVVELIQAKKMQYQKG